MHTPSFLTRLFPRAMRVGLLAACMVFALVSLSPAATDEAVDAPGVQTEEPAPPAGTFGAPAPTEPAVKTLPPSADLGNATIKMAGGLFLILGFLFIGFWALRRFGPHAGLNVLNRSDLQVEGQIGLGQKKSIVVVRFLNKRLVLGVTESNINLLTETQTGNEDDEPDFEKSLEKARSDTPH